MLLYGTVRCTAPRDRGRLHHSTSFDRWRGMTLIVALLGQPVFFGLFARGPHRRLA